MSPRKFWTRADVYQLCPYHVHISVYSNNTALCLGKEGEQVVLRTGHEIYSSQPLFGSSRQEGSSRDDSNNGRVGDKYETEAIVYANVGIRALWTG